ncbi:hypothetical protein [Gordonia sputi]|uniref:hypothetical protein n=1 Tax=Gordonia sputi TaxID=36823 RepID=UPI003677A842
MAESYRDEVVIEIHQIADRYSNPDVVDGQRIVVHPHGMIDLDWLNELLEAMFVTADESGQLRQGLYVLTQQRTETHWGAAGGQAHFLIETAATLTTGAVVSLIGHHIIALVDTLRARGYDVTHGHIERLTTQQVVEYGQRAIETHFDIPLSDQRWTSSSSNDRGNTPPPSPRPTESSTA